MVGHVNLKSTEGQFLQIHPYHPVNISLPHYEPNETPVVVLLGSFVAVLGIPIITVLSLSRRANPRLTTNDLLTIVWFLLSLSKHLTQFSEPTKLIIY
jgi:cholestenol Delta-isomerase